MNRCIVIHNITPTAREHGHESFTCHDMICRYFLSFKMLTFNFASNHSPEKEAKAAREERAERPQPARRLPNLVHPRLDCR